MKPVLVCEILGFALLTAFLEVLSVWILRSLFLVCLGQSNPIAKFLQLLPGVFSRNPGVNLVLMMLFGTFLYILVKNLVLVALWRTMLHRLANEMSDIAWRLYEHYLCAPYAVHAARSWTSLQHKLNVISTQIFNRLVFPSLLTLSELFVLAGIMTFLMIKAPVITILLVIWLGGTMLIFRGKVMENSRSAGKKRNASAERVLRLTHESLGNFKSIKLWARENFFVGLFRRNSLDLAHDIAEDRFMVQLPRFVFEPVLIGGLVALYLILIYRHASAARTFGDLTLYAAAAVRLLPAAQRVIGQIHLLAYDHGTLDEIASDFEAPMESLPERSQTAPFPPFEHALSLEDVSVTYPQGQAVLRGVSLEIERGEKIAITGKTGAGKTTVLNVILGLVRPTAGRILLDGKETAPLVRMRQSSMAYVQQDAFLLDASIADNVAFAVATRDVDYPRVWEALRCAHLADTVRKFPTGLESRIGENGIGLSGGERQRLALARAFYQNPSFLVLDEATSQLDVATEDAILTDLIERHPEITLIMVTHRTSTAARFSRCLRIKDGVVLETRSGKSERVAAMGD